MGGVQFPISGKKFFFLFHSVQTSSGTHPVYYPMRTGELKRPGLEADHSPLSRAVVRNSGAIHPLPHVFKACSLIRNRDSFKPYLYIIP
jgi:hypothetical protein